MKSLFASAAVVAMLAGAPLALAAAQQTQGTVKTYDTAGHEFTLQGQDNITFYLPSTFKDPGIRAGAKVQVTWDMQNGKHMASAVTLQN